MQKNYHLLQKNNIAAEDVPTPESTGVLGNTQATTEETQTENGDESTPGWGTTILNATSTVARNVASYAWSYVPSIKSSIQKETPSTDVATKTSAPKSTKEVTKTTSQKEGTFTRIARNQFLVTLGTTAVMTGASAYCLGSTEPCTGLMDNIAKATPIVITYLAFSTGIATQLKY